jgi:hypothetical protein
VHAEQKPLSRDVVPRYLEKVALIILAVGGCRLFVGTTEDALRSFMIMATPVDHPLVLEAMPALNFVLFLGLITQVYISYFEPECGRGEAV